MAKHDVYIFIAFAMWWNWRKTKNSNVGVSTCTYDSFINGTDSCVYEPNVIILSSGQTTM